MTNEMPKTIPPEAAGDAASVARRNDIGREGSARSGQALVDAFSASPFREVDIAPARCAMPVRPVTL